jgi:acyl-CoA synthetase (AMP-forming)/AMP-acid ligase II
MVSAVRPQAVALKVPRGRTRTGKIDYLTLSFQELDQEVGAWCDRITVAGIRAGDRTLVMVPPGLPLIAAVFALFNRGAVPVVIDPGMGLRSFLACVASSRPRALVGIPFARMASLVFRRAFGSVEVRVGASKDLTSRLTAAHPGSSPVAAPAAVNCSSGDLAAVLFTSGSTGAPKGVCYEHGMFDAQVRLIRDTYGIEPGEIDLPMLPIFALFNPALGMTTVVPEIDPRRPAAVDPGRIVQAIRQENVTNSFGSPTLWRKVAAHCRAANVTLPTLRRVLCAGAAVPADLWRDAPAFLPRGKLHSPYGATEALPVASVSSDEMSAQAARSWSLAPTTHAAAGACVGRPVREIEVKIIAIADEPIATLAAAGELPPGEIGEIIVRGPVVTRVYDALPRATAAAKIPDSGLENHETKLAGPPRDSCPSPSAISLPLSGAVWHRMGDCGYLDREGRLWFCGRKAERVETAIGIWHTEPCEQVFRAHPGVARCALIGLGDRPRQRVAVVVEADPKNSAQARTMARELRALALQHPHTAAIKLFYFRPQFPVDVRHNAKIHRLALARWALTAKGFEIDPKR